MDKTCINDCFYFFLPKSAGPGISMFCYESDLSEVYEEVSLGSQCQLLTTYDNVFRIHSFIRAASIGNKVLTAWIDGRDGLARIYANLFEITENLPDP